MYFDLHFQELNLYINYVINRVASGLEVRNIGKKMDSKVIKSWRLLVAQIGKQGYPQEFLKACQTRCWVVGWGGFGRDVHCGP